MGCQRGVFPDFAGLYEKAERRKTEKKQMVSAVVQFPFVNEKGVYHYPDRLMNEMEQHVVSRICEWIPEEKIFRWRE